MLVWTSLSPKTKISSFVFYTFFLSDIPEAKETLPPQRSQSHDVTSNQPPAYGVTLLPLDNHKLENNHKKRIDRQVPSIFGSSVNSFRLDHYTRCV